MDAIGHVLIVAIGLASEHAGYFALLIPLLVLSCIHMRCDGIA